MNVKARRPLLDAATGSGPHWASTTAGTGWAVLLVISVVGALNHLLGAVTFATGEDERLAFAMFASVNVYAVAVLLRPYRQRQAWAWLVTWLEVTAFASVVLLAGGGLGLGYLVVAVVAGLAQLATLPEFWPGLVRHRRAARLPATT